MHGALLGNLQQSRSLSVIKVASESNLAVHLIQKAGLGLTVLAVPGVNPLVPQIDLHRLQIHFFSFRIHAECNRSSRPQSRQQKFIGCGASIRTAHGTGFIA